MRSDVGCRERESTCCLRSVGLVAKHLLFKGVTGSWVCLIAALQGAGVPVLKVSSVLERGISCHQAFDLLKGF